MTLTENFCKKQVQDYVYPPFTQITYIALCVFVTDYQSYLMCCLLDYSPHFSPPKSFLLSCCAFLKVNNVTLFFMHSVQFSSVAQSCPTLCNPMNRSTPGLPVHHQLPEFTQTHAHRVGMPSYHLLLCRPLLLLPPIPPSIRVFSSESTFRMRWPKY